MDDVASLRRDIVFPATLRGRAFTFHSTWGLFSPTAIDDGTRLLVESLTVRPDDHAIDIGCGYGAIGCAIAAAAPRGRTHMVDRDFVAVEYAQKNAVVNGLRNCETYASNGFSRVPVGSTFDLVVANLPAKVGRELLWIILADARAHLRPGGSMVVVTISGLRTFIKRNLLEVFGNYEKVKQGKRYTVGRAVKDG